MKMKSLSARQRTAFSDKLFTVISLSSSLCFHGDESLPSHASAESLLPSLLLPLLPAGEDPHLLLLSHRSPCPLAAATRGLAAITTPCHHPVPPSCHCSPLPLLRAPPPTPATSRGPEQQPPTTACFGVWGIREILPTEGQPAFPSGESRAPRGTPRPEGPTVRTGRRCPAAAWSQGRARGTRAGGEPHGQPRAVLCPRPGSTGAAPGAPAGSRPRTRGARPHARPGPGPPAAAARSPAAPRGPGPLRHRWSRPAPARARRGGPGGRRPPPLPAASRPRRASRAPQLCSPRPVPGAGPAPGRAGGRSGPGGGRGAARSRSEPGKLVRARRGGRGGTAAR